LAFNDFPDVHRTSVEVSHFLRFWKLCVMVKIVAALCGVVRFPEVL
jgi:hypothetical protein